jgi:hypothetical protein
VLLQFRTPAVCRAFSAHRATARGPQKKGASTLRAEAPSGATHDPQEGREAWLAPSRRGGTDATRVGRHPVRGLSQREHFDQIVDWL